MAGSLWLEPRVKHVNSIDARFGKRRIRREACGSMESTISWSSVKKNLTSRFSIFGQRSIQSRHGCRELQKWSASVWRFERGLCSASDDLLGAACGAIKRSFWRGELRGKPTSKLSPLNLSSRDEIQKSWRLEACGRRLMMGWMNGRVGDMIWSTPHRLCSEHIVLMRTLNFSWKGGSS